MIEKLTNLIQILLPNLKGGKQIIIGLISTAIIAMVTVGFEKYLDYRLNQATTEIVEQVDTQVKDIVTETIDSEETKYVERINKALIKYPEIDMQIDELLSQLNFKLKANQSVLFIFHDGTRTPEGFPFIKYSATNEVINEGKINVSSKLETYQSVPYSKAAYYAKMMAEKDIYYVDDLKSMESYDGSNYYSLQEEGVKSIAFIPVTNRYNKSIIGFIVVYSYDKYISFKEHLDYMKTISSLIENDLHLKYKK